MIERDQRARWFAAWLTAAAIVGGGWWGAASGTERDRADHRDARVEKTATARETA